MKEFPSSNNSINTPKTNDSKNKPRTESILQNPVAAKKYYEQQIEHLVKKQPRLDSDKKDNLLSYYCQKRMSAIIQSNKEYNNNLNQYYPAEMSRRIIDGITGALVKLKDGKNLNIFGKSRLIVPEDNSFMGLSYSMDVEEPEFNEKEKIFIYNISITQLNDCPIHKFYGRILIDMKTGIVKFITMPNPREAERAPQLKINDLNAKAGIAALGGMANLISSINYNDNTFEQGRVQNKAKNEGMDKKIKPTTIDDEKYSTLPYRRRTINPQEVKTTEEAIDTTNNAVDELIKSIDEEIKNTIKTKSGKLELTIFDKDDCTEINIGEVSERMGSWEATDQQKLSIIASDILINNKHQMVITLRGLYTPRDLAGIAPGSSHRAHFRRAETKLILVIGNKVLPHDKKRMKTIWRLREAGGLKEGSQEEQELKKFLQRYNLSPDTSLDLEVSDGLHYKDGRFVEGHKINNPSVGYRQTYLKNKSKNI